MLVRCTKDVIMNGDGRRTFTEGEAYEVDDEIVSMGIYDTTNDEGGIHCIYHADTPELVEFFHSHFQRI